MTPTHAHDGTAPGTLAERATWIFDLDNTLYPPACNLFAQIDVRMGAFIGQLLGIDAVAARRVQKGYFMSHGTTLRGLMDHHGVQPEDFLSYVHDIDVSPVPANPRLERALARLDGRKLVFTNGSVDHAERVLDRLGVADLIDDVFDIAAADYLPKPHDETYRRFVAHYGIDAGAAVMVEDMARNLTPAARLGMTTVWLDTGSDWGRADLETDHVHHVIDDLTDWLEGLTTPSE